MINIVENDTAWRQPVTVMPFMQAFPEMQALSGMSSEFRTYNEKKVVVNESRDRLFGVFGKKSVVVPHQDLVNIMEDVYKKLYSEDGEINVTSMKDGAQVVIKMDIPLETPLDVGNGDTSNLMLLAQNSYDHGLSLKIRTGIMRLICTNGAIAGEQIASITARELLDGFNSHTLAAKVNRMMEKSKILVDVWQKWMEIDIPRMVAGSVLEHHFPKKFIEPIMDMEDFPVSKYNLYNALTRRSTHDVNTEKARWQMDTAISRIFYSNSFEKFMRELELEKAEKLDIIDGEISDHVTETNEITH